MKDAIITRVQFDGRWYLPGQEKELHKSKATKDHYERWRIDGAIEGFDSAGVEPEHEPDSHFEKRKDPTKDSTPASTDFSRKKKP